MNPPPTPPLHVAFDPTPEIFASDNHGTFLFPLRHAGRTHLDTSSYDELRFVVSLWHPSEKQSIDLDSAYVELRASFDPEDDHWIKLAEIEPVVPPYNSGESFDGWIVLPVLGARTGLRLFGSGFEARARLQLRASAYLVG
ncbi:MAG TPA: hypothetical protein VMV46_22840 [Thermoanaerobaculia bacterium]|nr:hypothetical protein [Thermoanaerobaculia bacterium]